MNHDELVEGTAYNCKGRKVWFKRVQVDVTTLYIFEDDNGYGGICLPAEDVVKLITPWQWKKPAK